MFDGIWSHEGQIKAASIPTCRLCSSVLRVGTVQNNLKSLHSTSPTILPAFSSDNWDVGGVVKIVVCFLGSYVACKF